MYIGLNDSDERFMACPCSNTGTYIPEIHYCIRFIFVYQVHQFMDITPHKVFIMHEPINELIEVPDFRGVEPILRLTI